MKTELMNVTAESLQKAGEILRSGGDSYDRVLMRVDEIKESIKIIRSLIGNIPEGEYGLEIGIKCDDGEMLYFATDAERNDGFYTLGKTEITKRAD